jgi:predicted PurR-regulated permease PerM
MNEKTGNDSTKPLSYSDLLRWSNLVVLVILSLAVAFALKGILLLFAVTLIAGMVLNPAIAALERRGVKRGLAVALLILVGLGLVALAVKLLLPPFLQQAEQFIQGIPDDWEKIHKQLSGLIQEYPVLQQVIPAKPSDLINTASAQVGGVASFLVRSTIGFFDGIVIAALCLLLLIFTLLDPEPMVACYLELTPSTLREPARRTLIRMLQQMAVWARGTLINGVITGASTGLLLALIGVQPALVFGVIAFFGEFVPIIGPVVVAIPALFVAASLGFGKFCLALLAILFVQQVETNVLIPFVMGKQMNLHPVTIIFFTLAMGTLFGGIGAILVVPAAAFVKIVISEFYLSRRHRDQKFVTTESHRIVIGEGKLDG